MDRITLRGVRAFGRHGANPGERDHPQPFEVDLALYVDARAAQRSDRLEDTVNYADVHRRVVRIVETESFVLLERLAAAIADDLFQDARIERAEVTIAKPNLLDGATPAVTIVRTRS